MKLDLVPQQKCAELAAVMNVSVDVELCAGKRLERRKEAYLAEKINADDYVFSLKQPEHGGKGKGDVTYGGRDACTGDDI